MARSDLLTTALEAMIAKQFYKRRRAMDFLLMPLLCAVLIALSFKSLRRALLKALGQNDKFLVLEVRIGAILFLLCANVMAAIDYWYPWYLCTYHAAPDDRYGFAIEAGFPFWFVGAGISAWALFHLIRAVFGGKRSLLNVLCATLGILLAVGGFLPLIVFCGRLLVFSAKDF